MAKQIVPAGSQWAGLQAHMDSADIPEEASQACENAYFWLGQIGLLGPREGKDLQGNADQNIMGVFPYRIGGQTGLLVAMSNGETVFMASYAGRAPSGSLNPPSSIAINSTTYNLGFLTITINQFNQVVNVAANQVGLTRTIIQCVPIFDSATCAITYNKWTWTYTNGMLTALLLEVTGTCNDDDNV